MIFFGDIRLRGKLFCAFVSIFIGVMPGSLFAQENKAGMSSDRNGLSKFLISKGISKKEAEARVNSLTDNEIKQIEETIRESNQTNQSSKSSPKSSANEVLKKVGTGIVIVGTVVLIAALYILGAALVDSLEDDDTTCPPNC